MRQLVSMHVYQPQGVSVSWKFKTAWGTTISGRPEKGRVMLATDTFSLKIYLIAEDMEIGCPPLELTDEMATFCGIQESKHISLLTHILVQRDVRRIEQDLNRREVPDNIPKSQEEEPDTINCKFSNFICDNRSELQACVGHPRFQMHHNIWQIQVIAQPYLIS